MVKRPDIEAERLEQLWAGDFGNAYIERNTHAAQGRSAFWESLVSKYGISRVLEVGCNLGANLFWIAQHVLFSQLFGLDINEEALRRLHKSLPGIGALRGVARALPFEDRSFDLVFTAGVLIHQPESALPLTMSEIVRCSRRYVLCMEYSAEKTVEVSYRGQRGALFKRNYGQIYLERFPFLRLLEQGELSPEQGWDNLTYWMLRKA